MMESTLLPLEKVALRYLNDSLELNFTKNEDFQTFSNLNHNTLFMNDTKSLQKVPTFNSQDISTNQQTKTDFQSNCYQQPYFPNSTYYLHNDSISNNQTSLDFRKQQAFIVLQNIIKGTISQDAGVQLVRQLINKSDAAEKIISILNVPSIPLPSTKLKSSPNQTNSQSMPFTNSPIEINSKSLVHNWSQLEDNRLLCGIHKFGLDNWDLISKFVGGDRTKAQCAQRWLRGLDPSISKQPWTNEEDEKLLQLISLYGLKNWKRIASNMPNRSDAQCRYRHMMLNKAKRKSKSKRKNQNSSKKAKKEAKIQNDLPFDFDEDDLNNFSKSFPFELPVNETTNSINSQQTISINKEQPIKMCNTIQNENISNQKNQKNEFLIQKVADIHENNKTQKEQKVVLINKAEIDSDKEDEYFQDIFKFSDSEWEKYSFYDSPFISMS